MKRPCGQTLGLALILLGLFAGVGEAVVRTQVFRTHVVAKNRGGRHGQFELQLGRLESVVARDGHIDCIFLGNSMTWHSFDPEGFAEGYRRQTGSEIRCFNFGVDGLPTVSAGALAGVLAEEFKPALLIYGTSARDYVVPMQSEDNTVLLEMPWLKYRLGEFSLRGWLHGHSRLYQYWETLGCLLRLERPDLLWVGYYASHVSNYGFYGHEGVAAWANVPLDAQSENDQIRGYFALLSKYKMLPENLAGLQQVMAQNRDNVQVLVVEMPIPPAYLSFFDHGEQDYRRFLDKVEGITASRGIPFWQTTRLRLIPEDGWFDYVYPNTGGAWVFSAWLGEQLGSAVLHGKLEDPVADH